MKRWMMAPARLARPFPAWALLTLLAAAMLVAACGGGGNSDGESDDGAAATTAAGADTDSLEEVATSVLFKDNVFEPLALTFPVGSKVTFNYDNVGLAVHNMIIQSKDAEGQNFQSPVAVNPGEKGAFEATFTKAGTFQFICVYHMPGMEGTITIE